MTTDSLFSKNPRKDNIFNNISRIPNPNTQSKIISKYVCIDYLGYEKSKLSDLLIGVYGRYKHLDKNYDNPFGI